MRKNEYGTIDLHLHLDGSLSAEIIWKLAEMCEEELPVDSLEELTGRLTVAEDCRDLNEYLNCFDLPGRVLQTRQTLQAAVEMLGEELKEQGLTQAEIRFAPQLHTHRGLTQHQVIAAVLEGVKSVQSDGRIQLGILLCAMRGEQNDQANDQTVEEARYFLGKGVCGMDIAGAEALYPNEKYKDLFQKIRAYQIPFTIHSGEALGVESIRQALDFGAVRIGHGIRCVESPELMRELAEKKVVLELCPTSNLQTRALNGVEKIEEYPIPTLIRYGVRFTINTDNMTVSGTTLQQEYEKLIEAGVLTRDQAIQADHQAHCATFLNLMEESLQEHIEDLIVHRKVQVLPIVKSRCAKAN